ncbi:MULTISPECIES: pyrroline-5-carboxylate reductase [unclassified Pseudovibrio]|uniref:pyrroline-5-carboxylate reductase n=1 Tax=unclassified Pseudovibrio TaxID=2627060 RepID=UPI0007AE6B0F|nr:MULTISPECIES: pyrroline-5-carboxylate reductase [unclassified Pseudovibrio]KZL03154.1 Pyrroline-5-carboxylate reductase [Pseudovibrio sp. W74]KZL04828.1 Pyrroline-5-carboxylate reductase [Pseudovibrio sp. Ad14]
MKLTNERPLVLIGAGKMGGAMLAGWMKQGMAPEHVVVVDPNPPSDTLETITAHSIPWHKSVPEGVVAGVLLMAIKPQMMEEVLPTLTDVADEGSIILSVAAGTTIKRFKDTFGAAQPVVRVIPNTPSQVGRGVTAGYASVEVLDEQKALMSSLLETIGAFYWVDAEEQIDLATAVSGSGPAYVFHLVEAMSEAGQRLGLNAELAEALARGTVAGSGELLHQSPENADVLRRNVTSPGGTTAAALSVLMGDDALTNLMSEAVAKAAHRATELAD